MKHVKYSKDEGVGTIQLHRPEVYNSFNATMSKEVQQALDEAARDPDVRCIVLTGTGKAFSAGQDLKEATAADGPTVSQIISEHYNPIIERLYNIEKPIVAALNGMAVGAGTNIALACDLVVAKESTTITQGFGKIGLIPDCGGTFTLPRLIGLQQAKALMFLNESISASDAEKMGLIYKAVPDDEFDTTIQQLTQRLSKMATKAVGLTKRALNHSVTNNLYSQLQKEEELQQKAFNTFDREEGISAFLEKRKPKYEGR